MVAVRHLQHQQPANPYERIVPQLQRQNATQRQARRGDDPRGVAGWAPPESQFTQQRPWALRPVDGDPRHEDPYGYQPLEPAQQRQARQQEYEEALLEQRRRVGAGLRSEEWQSAPAIQRARAMQPSIATERRQHFASREDEYLYDQDGQFSPYAYGGNEWRNGVQAHVPNIRERIFDKSGQINASDKKDALRQSAYLLQDSIRRARAPQMQRRRASQEERQERMEVLAAAVQDQVGFQVLGQELMLPVKEIMDYEGWARRVFRVKTLQQGEYFRVSKDVRSTAWIIGQDGQGVEARMTNRVVVPDEFKIGSFPTVDIEDIYMMNFDVLDRAQDTARQEIELEEDKRGRILIDTIATAVNTPVLISTLGLSAFEDVRYQVERHRQVVEHFLINRAELSDIVKTMSASVDPVTERELILAGYIGSILNATIMTSAGTGVQEVVPAGTFYAVVGPDNLGEMGVRIELFSEPFNMFASFRFVKGWAVGEMLGFVAPNGKCAAKGSK